MEETFESHYCSLHVRKSNTAAIHLYRNTLGFKVHDTEEKYYADDEDALDMRKTLKPGIGKEKLQKTKKDKEKEAKLKEKETVPEPSTEGKKKKKKEKVPKVVPIPEIEEEKKEKAPKAKKKKNKK